MRERSVSLLSSTYRAFSKFSAAFQSPFLLAVRLYWGWQFAQSGWGKLHSIPRVTEFFVSLNIPLPHFNAVLVSNLEFFGGLFLIFGIASRLTGLLLTGNMLVAYLTADREALGSILSDPGKFYAADPYTFLFASLIVLIFGAGLFSADAVLERVMEKRSTRIRTPWPTSFSADGAQRFGESLVAK